MINRNLRWGVLGTANIGRAAVIPAIQRSRNGTLVAIASRDQRRADEFVATAKINLDRTYGSYEALLAEEDIDAIYIPLPNSLHKGWTIKAAQAGKHILCEKPLALNVEECAQMEEAAVANGVKLMEAFMYRFHPQTSKVIELLQSGAIGEVSLIRATFSFLVKDPENIRCHRELGGGSLMDVGSYCVNVCRTLMGEEPIEVQAFARWGDTGVDEQLVGSLRFVGDRFAQFDSALTLERWECYQVVGTEGHLDVPMAFLPGRGDTTIYEYHGRSEPISHTISGVDEYQLMVEHFADCILDDQPCRYSPSEAGSNMRVIQALYRSARNSGRPEAIKSVQEVSS